MGKILLVLTLAAMSLTAGDVSGKWSGSILVQNADTGTETKPAFLVLKQDGGKLTGTAGPNESEQFEIQEGKVDGGRITFKVEEQSISFDLKQEGDELVGEATRDRDGEGKQIAKLKVKRVP